MPQIRVELHSLGAILFCKYLSSEVKNLSRETWVICFSFQLEVNIAFRDVSSDSGVSEPWSKAGTPAWEDLSVWQNLESTSPRNRVFLGDICTMNMEGCCHSPQYIASVKSCLIWCFFVLCLLLVYVACYISRIPW